MTNVLQPIGFQLARDRGARAGHNEYPILSTLSELIGVGDLVRQNNAGNIVKCAANVTPIGIFQGWQFSTRPMGGGSQGGIGNDGSVPFKKCWTGAQTVPTNAGIRCIIQDDPGITLIAQTRGTIAAADRGLLVDMSDAPGGPDVLTFGRSRQKVTCPTTYYNITAIAVDGGTQGSGFTQDGVDLVVDGVIEDLRAGSITVTAGAVTLVTLLNPIVGIVAGSAAISVQAKPGYSGVTATGFTGTYSAAQTANQFRIKRVLEKPFRAFDSSNNTTGYDLSAAGLYSWVELEFARHMRAGTALFGAPAS